MTIRWTCAQAREHLQAKLDGVIGRWAGRQLRVHLESCGACEAELAQLRRLRATLGSLGEMAAPENLALRLRIAISREAARQQDHLRDRLRLRWQNTGRELALRWSAGLASSLALVGTLAILIGMFAVPAPVQASDEPLGAMAPARLLYSSFPHPALNPGASGTVMVQVDINREGRIYDYRLLQGELDDHARAELENSLIFSVFEPAQMFGEPVRSQKLISFASTSAR